MIPRILLFFIFSIALIFSIIGQANSYLNLSVEKAVSDIKNGLTTVDGHQLTMPDNLIRLYESNGFSALWWWNGTLNEQANEALAIISASGFEGLNPADYHFEKLTALKKTILKKNSKSPESIHLTFELLLTDGLLAYAEHLHMGKVAGIQAAANWYLTKTELEINYADYILNALQYFLLSESFDKLKPTHIGYDRLKSSLKYYRKLKSAHPLSDLDNFGRDDEKNYPLNNIWIAKRLEVNGFLREGNIDNTDTIKMALIAFKKQHGLENNPTVDFKTLAELNITIDSRINTIIANLERWRWMPRHFEEHYVLVNIPDYSLKVIVDNEIMAAHKVIVGSVKRQTPVINTKITGVIIHPYWTVPPTILKEDILPLKKNVPAYLHSHRIEILDNDFHVISPDSVNWQTISTKHFHYQLRQKPGSNSALGQIKFDMPNSYSIYLHDTPAKNLFSERIRAFSSGCIRVDNPFKLAEFLFNSDGQNPSKLYLAKERKNTEYLRLKSPWQAYIIYLTAWVDDRLEVNFREDVYHLDQTLIKELSAPVLPRLPR